MKSIARASETSLKSSGFAWLVNLRGLCNRPPGAWRGRSGTTKQAERVFEAHGRIVDLSILFRQHI